MAAAVTFTFAPARIPTVVQSVLVANPTSTIAVQLMPAPVPRLTWQENPAIVVPVLTFVGVLITVGLGVWKTNKELTTSDNKWRVDRDDAREKVEKDRSHAAEEARKARLVTARREVYLELIKEMTAASMALGGMAFQKGEEIDIQAGFQGFLSAAARVGILGDMNSVVQSRELMKMVMKVLYKKLPEVMELRTVKSEQQKLQDAKKKQLEKSEDIRRIMADLLQASRLVDVKPWSDALEQSELQTLQFDKDVSRYGDAYSELAKAYQRSILPDTAEIAQKTNELIECIRAELELMTDSEVLRSTTAAMYADAAAAVASLQKTQADEDPGSGTDGHI